MIADRERYAEVGRAYRQLQPAAELAAQWRAATDDAAVAEELLEQDGDDADTRRELQQARERAEELEEQIRIAMVERDPNDEKNVIVEIQGGAGGEEAGLWAGDLYRMLTRYAERRGYQVEQLDIGDGKYTFAVKGDGAYSVFKFEGGTHRVQRVPEDRVPGADPHLDRDRRGAARRPRTWTSRSTPATCRSTCTAPPAPAGSRSTRPTRPCASRTGRAGSWSRCRTRSPSCRTASRRCGCCARGCTSGRWPNSRPSWRPTAARRSDR